MNTTRIDRGMVCLVIVAIALSHVLRVVTATAPEEAGNIVGAWLLNAELSDDPPEARDEARSRGGGRMPGGGRPGGFGGGMRGRGVTRGGSMPDREEMRDRRELLELLVQPPPTLKIAQGAGAVTFAERDGRTTTYATNGKKEKHVLGTTQVETRTRWDGRRLVKEISAGGGVKATETYSIDENDGGRLHVLVKVESAPMPRLTLRRVYDAVHDVEAP